MTETIRTARVDEFDEVMRLMERSFGAQKGTFERHYPHCFRPIPEACTNSLVLEQDGVLVAHVGLIPVQVVSDGVSLTVAGISGVATAPEERGKGYMSRLLKHAIHVMREQGYAISGLGGDRQRYGLLGWEYAGRRTNLHFSGRSLEWAHVERAEVEEVYPWEAIGLIRDLRPRQACHGVQAQLERLLHKADVRAWVSTDGYVLGRTTTGPGVEALELVSATGSETRLVRAVLEWTDRPEVYWPLPSCDRARLARVIPAAASWSVGYDWCYRIVDPVRLLDAARETLQARAEGLADWRISLAIGDSAHSDTVTLGLENGRLLIEPGRHTEPVVSLDLVQAARLLLGGPPIEAQPSLPPGLLAMLPIPVHVPPIEHV